MKQLDLHLKHVQVLHNQRCRKAPKGWVDHTQSIQALISVIPGAQGIYTGQCCGAGDSGWASCGAARPAVSAAGVSAARDQRRGCRGARGLGA